MATSNALNLQTSKVRITLTVTDGADKGSSFQIVPPKVIIGRDPSCHIVLQDGRCSRQQAAIHIQHDQMTIEDLSSKKTTFVNGNQVQQAELRHGDTLLLGETSFLFRAELVNNPGLQVVQPGTPMKNPSAPPGVPRPQGLRAQPRQNSNGKLRFYIISAVILSSLVYFLSTSTGPKIIEATIRNQDKVDAEIKRAEAQAAEDVALKKIDTAEARSHFDLANKKYNSGNEKYAKGDFAGATKDFEDTVGLFTEFFGAKKFATPEEHTKYVEANKHYLEGFRDYSQGQYSRAIRSFETALAIDSTHKLAERYREYAYRAREETVSGNLELGKQYHEKQMYSRCSASLEKVLIEIRNESDIRYKEAVALKRICDNYVRKDD